MTISALFGGLSRNSRWLVLLALLVCCFAGQALAAGVSYVYDAAGRLLIAYDAAGDAALYSYDAAGNLLAITDYPAGTLAAITTSSGSEQPGATLTIYGTDFCASPTVTVDGTAATVDSATATQIVITVPNGAGSGAVAVTCGGNQVNAGNLTVNSGNLPSITSFTPTLGPTGTAVTVNGSNFQSSPDSNDIWFNNSRGTVTAATSTTLGTAVPSYATSGHLTVATQTGTAVSSGYFFVPPGGLTTSQIGSTTSTTIGTPVTVTIGTAGMSALVAFDGTAGQPVSLYVSGSNFPGCYGEVQVTVTLYNPDGSTLGTLTPCAATGIIAGLTLPETGSYTIAVTPSGSNTGHMTLTVYSTPTLTQAITIDGAAVNVSSAIPGQNMALTFTGSANEQLAVEMTNSNFPGCYGVVQVTVSVQTASGTTLESYTPCSASSVFQGITLPAADNYQILITPVGTNTGGMTLKIYDTPTVNGTISIGGAPVTVSDSEPGQDIAVTFSGTAGQYVELNSSNQTLSCAAATILNPDQSTLATQGGGTGCYSIGEFPLERLPQTGTYTIYINTGSSTTTGSVTLQLYNASRIAPAPSDSYGSTIAGDHPLAYWRLAETSGPTAANSAADGAYPGVPVGGITYGVTGALNGDSETAITLNGSTGEIELPAITASTANVTLECWVNISANTHGALIKIGTSSGGYGIGIGNGTWDSSGNSLIGLYEYDRWLTSSSNPTLSFNTWHHVALVIDGSGNPTLYLDGTAYAVSTGAPLAPSGMSYIGNDPADSTRWIAASVEEATVYPTALSASQIDDHYLAGITAPANYATAGITGGSDYKAVILNDSPQAYYRLGDASGTQFILDSAQAATDNGLYQGNETFGVTGPLGSDNAVTFNGSSGYLTSILPYINPQAYSVEAWFMTSSGYNKGGKIAGFNSAANGSGSNDRHIYMTNSGQIIFGTYDGAVHTVTSSADYNDGNWHYVVGTATGTGIALYIDNNLIGSTSGGSQNYTGYWMLGYGDFGGWPSLPTSDYFGGTIGEAAVYPYALSATQVANHYNAR